MRVLGREDWFWIVGALLAVLLFVAVEARAMAAAPQDGGRSLGGLVCPAPWAGAVEIPV